MEGHHKSNQKDNYMNVMIMDTETTGLDKPFCYDIGYCVYDTCQRMIVERKHFVIEQIWHNLPLFESAYYAQKRPLYVQLMRQHRATMDKWGYVMREIHRDIQKYGITDAYAYNSNFDDKVITFNCDWFKCINPFDTIAIHDIWGYASQFITNTPEYQHYCEINQYFTDTGNYKGSAEIVYRYIIEDDTFEEMHMGLYDVEIETAILTHCIDNLGAQWNTDYEVKRVLERVTPKAFTIKFDKQVVFKGTYLKKVVRKDVISLTGVEEE